MTGIRLVFLSVVLLTLTGCLSRVTGGEVDSSITTDPVVSQEQPAKSPAPVAATPATPSGPTPGSLGDFVISVQDRVFFGFDVADLTPSAQSVLTDQANWLIRYPSVLVTIEGHTDERGTRDYNLALSERRANAVRQYLINQGVNALRIRTIGYGKERPAVLGSYESAWSQNRRSVTVVEIQ